MNIWGLKVKILIKILLLVVFIVVSGIYWDNLDITKYADFAKKSSEGNFVGFNVESDYGYVLNLLDNKGNNDTKFNLNVYNEINASGYYEIALALNKSCDYKKLYLSIDNKIYNLNDLFVKTDGKYNYFMIANSVIEREEVTYSLGLYIDYCDAEYFSNNSIELSFVDLGVNKL